MGSTIVILAALGAAAYWFLKRRQAPNAASSRRTPHAAAVSVDKQFASVVLHCAGAGCQAARRLQDRQLLAVEAPALPLADCDRTNCACSYRKAGDRRQEDGRRTADVGITPIIYDGQEMRAEAADRRQ